MEFDEIIEEYIDLVKNNKDNFSQDLIKIFETKDCFKGCLWLKWDIKKELEYCKNKDFLKLEKIVAPGQWKEIFFLLLYKAFIDEIDKIKLKVEPLFLLNNLNENEARRKLVDFYGYFLFKLVDNFWNMEFDINDISDRDLEILLNRLKYFLDK